MGTILVLGTYGLKMKMVKRLLNDCFLNCCISTGRSCSSENTVNWFTVKMTYPETSLSLSYVIQTRITTSY